MRVLPATLSARKSVLFLTLFAVCGLALKPTTAAQEASASNGAASHPLITQPVNEAQRTILKGNTHPLARREFDLGTAPASLPMDRMLLVLKRSPDQEAALRKLLDDQQDKSTPNYHKWLTPDQYGKQFGPTDDDLQKITAWLQSHGFQVGTTKGRTVLEFSGSASQVQEAFQTTIHKYIVNGEQHWANATDPSIPTALTGAVAGVLTLHNFIKKPASHFSGEPVPAKIVPGKKPDVTFTQNGQVIHALAPSDYATIYNIIPVYQSLIAGSSVSIGVVGRSNLFNGGQDVEDFAGTIGFGDGGYGGALFQILLNGPDPGDLGGGEEAEATLDSTWSTTVASGVGSVVLVVSATTNTTDGVDLSEAYIVENNLTAIMTESFSSCELFATDTQLAGATALAQQAAAQGITYFVSSGDNGAEGCDDPSVAPASHPVSVNHLASTAFDTAVGGTMFNENGHDSTYWTSTPPISETARSYIPENVWNESSLSNGLWAGSGGASAGNVSSGVGTTGGIPKPSWQSGVTGIPSDGVRDLPDVSLTAASHDPYLVCLEGSCVPNQGQIFVYFISGTSASAPSFAGIMSLVDKQQSLLYQNSGRQGMANYVLYRLAASQSAYPGQCNGSGTSSAPASTCIFNDITMGNNVVPGETGNQYQAGAGYDLATGLGSVNVANLVNQWNSVSFNPTTTTVTAGSSPIVHGSPVSFSALVSPNSGSGVPTGAVSLLATPLTPRANQTSLGLWDLSGGAVSGSTSSVPGGTYQLTAYYPGDPTYAPSTGSSGYFTVSSEPSSTTLSVLSFDQLGNAIPFTSGPFGSFVYLRADVRGQSGQGIPTGSVTFNDTFGLIPGGSVFSLNGQGNTATPNGILNFDSGTHTISAVYNGDASFQPGSSPSATFTITPGFYAAVPSAQSTVVVSAPGSSAQSSVVVSNSTGFSGTINLSCSGLPSEAACLFSPASVSANGNLGSATVTITVTTTAPTAMMRSQHLSFLAAQWVMGAGFFGLLLFGRQKRVRTLALFAVCMLLVVAPSCGGGGGGGTKGPPPNPGTPKGSALVTVTATSGGSVSTTGFFLIVQ